MRLNRCIASTTHFWGEGVHLWVDDGTVGRAMVCCQYKLNHRCIWLPIVTIGYYGEPIVVLRLVTDRQTGGRNWSVLVKGGSNVHRSPTVGKQHRLFILCPPDPDSVPSTTFDRRSRS